MKLDRNRPYGTSFSNGCIVGYQQDGIDFTPQGEPEKPIEGVETFNPDQASRDELIERAIAEGKDFDKRWSVRRLKDLFRSNGHV